MSAFLWLCGRCGLIGMHSDACVLVSEREREAARAALERLRERVAVLPGQPCSCSDAICDEHAELCVGGRCEDWPGAKLAVLTMIDEEMTR